MGAQVFFLQFLQTMATAAHRNHTSIVITISCSIFGYLVYKTYFQTNNATVRKNKSLKKSSRKKRSSLKLSQNHDCITLELNPKIISKLNELELSKIKTRKDKTSFLIFCSNCLQPGHVSSKCIDRYKVCVTGDSHTAFWGVAARFYINTDVVRIRIPGMSAQGLINKDSHLKSAEKIISAFTKCHNGNSGYLFIQIGQVDIDYVWYFRQMKYKNTLNFRDQIDKSIDNLFVFLRDNILNSTVKDQEVKIIVHGVHLPPLDNKDMRDKLYHHFMNRAGLTKEYLDEYLILPSHRERTQMALQFNKKLKQKCKGFGCLFVEISSEIIDEKTGIVQDKYVKQNEVDIHLDPKSLISIYHQKFKALNLDFAMKIDSKWKKLQAFQDQLRQRLSE